MPFKPGHTPKRRRRFLGKRQANELRNALLYASIILSVTWAVAYGLLRLFIWLQPVPKIL